MTEEGYPGNQEVEKSGGAPVEEGPATTPGKALDQEPDGAGEQRNGTDKTGHEPDDSGAA